MSNDQQLEPSLERQLADYFGWLEQHLGTTMSPAVVEGHSAPRRHFALAAAGCVVAVAAVAGFLVTLGDSATPSIEASITTNSASSGTATSNPAPTVAAATGEATIWAPMNLPGTMEVVGVYRGVRFDHVTPTVQYFGRIEGNSLATQLIVEVVEGGNFLVTDTEIHGLPATMLHPSATSVSVEWTEGDVHVTATGSGLTDREMLDLLEQTSLRADPLQGIDPQSVGGDMTELLSFFQQSRAEWGSFVIHDTSSDTYVWIEPGLNFIEVGLLEEVQIVAGVGRIFRDANGQSVLVTVDGAQITLGHWAIYDPPTEAQQVAVAQALALANAEQIETVRTEAERQLLELPSLEEVQIGDHILVIRGATREAPVALCLRNLAGESCHFNAVDRRLERPKFDQMAITKVVLSGEWFVIGYNQGEVGLDNELVARSLCIANADGSVTEVLPDLRVDVDGRQYFTAAVPPSVDFVRSCYLDDGALVAASSGMLTRPTE